jgi:hypothetical protein
MYWNSLICISVIGSASQSPKKEGGGRQKKEKVEKVEKVAPIPAPVPVVQAVETVSKTG